MFSNPRHIDHHRADSGRYSNHQGATTELVEQLIVKYRTAARRPDGRNTTVSVSGTEFGAVVRRSPER